MSAPQATLLDLVVRRTINASAARLFEAWTKPEHFKVWWGPPGVSCSDVAIDLRVGGTYRIANQQPDGAVVWISGEFERIEPPRRLVFTWHREGGDEEPERVTVRFEPTTLGEHNADKTDVIVVHERIANEATRKNHEQGWLGCLDGLNKFVETA